MWKEERIADEMQHSESESEGEHHRRFQPVAIFGRCDPWGHTVPHHMVYEDRRGVSRRVRISRVLREEMADARKSPVPDAGGIRYTVAVNGHSCVLYRVGDTHWFLSLDESSMKFE